MAINLKYFLGIISYLHILLRQFPNCNNSMLSMSTSRLYNYAHVYPVCLPCCVVYDGHSCRFCLMIASVRSLFGWNITIILCTVNLIICVCACIVHCCVSYLPSKDIIRNKSAIPQCLQYESRRIKSHIIWQILSCARIYSL